MRRIRINKKYFRVRTMLLILPLFTLFLVFILFEFILPDYLTTQEDLQTDNGIIQNVYSNKYVVKNKLNTDVYYNCVDILLKDKSYIVRLTDKLSDNYWPVITNKNNIAKTIQLEYKPRLLHDTILYNPTQISINHKLIIPYNSTHNFIAWSILIMITIISICTYFFFVALKTYKADFYETDKKIGQQSKWKLFSVWLTE